MPINWVRAAAGPVICGGSMEQTKRGKGTHLSKPVEVGPVEVVGFPSQVAISEVRLNPLALW